MKNLELKTDTTPYFSILIPVYNTSNTLERCLESVINQTYKNIEIICVNDCSTDNSKEILSKYENLDKRIKIISHEKNRKLLIARISGMKIATGNYFLFLDSDDYFELDACQKLFNYLENHKKDIVEFRYIKEPSKEVEPIKKNYKNRVDAIMNLKHPYPVTIWNKAYKKDVVKQVMETIEPFEAVFAEDVFFSFVFATFAKRFGYINNVLIHYSIGTGISTNNITKKDKLIEILTSCKEVESNIKEFLEKNNKKYACKVSDYMKYHYKHIESMIKESEDIYNNIELLKVYDEITDNKITDKYIKSFYIFNKFQNSSRKNKLFYLIRSTINILLNKEIFMK